MVNTVPSDYVTGTITLTNGSAAFTGTGTGWLAMMFRQGDLILDLPDAPQYVAIIDEVTTNTAGVLTRPWLGPTLTGAYRMRYQWDAGRVTAMSAFLREELGNGNLQAFAALVGSAGGVPVFIGPGAMEIRPATDFTNGVAYDVQVDTLADRAAYDGQVEGFAVLVSDVGDGRSALFSKASAAVADWTDPAYITGPIGASPNFAAGTTTTVPPGTPADVDLVPDGSGGYLFNFDIPAGEGFLSRGPYSGATAYNKGDVVQNNGSSWVAKIATTGNAPPVLPTTSNTWWELLAAAGMNGTGTGDVVGPASATADAVALFDGTTGKIIKDSARLIQTSVTDATLGRLMGVGAFGLGKQIVSTEANLNNYTLPGSYVTPAGPTNAPAWFTPGSRYVIDVSGETYASQIITDPETGQIASRGYTGAGYTRWNPVSPLGSIVNSWYGAYNLYFSGAAIVPVDDTPPLATEGVQIISVTTSALKSPTNKLRMRFSGLVGADAITSAILSLHINGNPSVRTSFGIIRSAGDLLFMGGEYEFTPGATTAVTVTVRAGAQSSNVRLNGLTSRLFGGASGHSLVVEEIAS